MTSADKTPEMWAELREIDEGDVVALAAPGFADTPAELGLIDAEALRALLATPGAGGGRAGTHALVTSGGSALVLRPFRRGGWLAKIQRPSRLRSPQRWFDELRVTHALRQRGAAVPQPAFAIACRSRAGSSSISSIWESWEGAVVTVRIEGASSAASHAADPAVSTEELATAAAACGSAVRAFHDCGGSHADLHAGNLLLAANDATNEAKAWVIDLDRARVGNPPGPRQRARELARLARSLEKLGLEKRLGEGCAREFCDAYSEGDPELAARIAKAWRSERWAIALHRIGY